MLKEVNTMKGSRMCRPIPSRGGGVLKVIVILLLVIGIGAGIWGWRVKSGSSSKKVNLIYATAERGVFVHEVNGKGSAESAKSITFLKLNLIYLYINLFPGKSVGKIDAVKQ